MVPEVRGRHRRPGYGEKNPLRLAQANGCRQSDWETCAGTVELRTSQAGERPLLPRFLGPDQGHDLPPPGHQICKQPGLLVSQRLWLDPGHRRKTCNHLRVDLGALASASAKERTCAGLTTTTGRPTAGSVAAARISKPPSPPAPPPWRQTRECDRALPRAQTPRGGSASPSATAIPFIRDTADVELLGGSRSELERGCLTGG